MNDFEGKVVLVTGGTGGLGEAVTDAFLAAGARVVLLWRSTPPRSQQNVIPIQCDVTRTDSVNAAVSEALAAEGRIDALVHMVGGYAGGRAGETDDDTWDRMLDLNVTAAFRVIRAVLPRMLERRLGRIVVTGSRAATRPFPGAISYIVSKSALNALVGGLALELAGTGVTVNAVLPTTIDTPANRRESPGADVSRWTPPAALARTFLYLASEDTAEINGALVPIG